MSLASTAGKIIGGIVLGIFLIALVASNSMAQFTEHDNLQPVIIDAIGQQMPALDQAQFDQLKATLALACQQPGRTSVNLKEISASSPDLTIECAALPALVSPHDLVDFFAATTFDQIYYKSYSCDFISCLSELPDQDKFFVIVSAYANAFFKQLMLISIAGIIVGIAIIVLSVRKISPILQNIGIEAAITGIVGYVGLNSVAGMLPAGATTSVAAPLITGLMQTLSTSFMIVLVIGIVLAVVGFAGAHLTKPKSAKAKPAKKRR